MSKSQIFTIIIDDVNEAPTSIRPLSASVAENQKNALVQVLAVSDPDTTVQRFVLSVQGRDSPFKVLGTVLTTTIPLNYEKKNQYIVTVKVIDQGGELFVPLIIW